MRRVSGDVACRLMGVFKVLNPTGILLENYTERKKPKRGLFCTDYWPLSLVNAIAAVPGHCSEESLLRQASAQGRKVGY